MKITQITKIPIQFRHNKNYFLRVNKLIVKVFSCKIQKLNVNGGFFSMYSNHHFHSCLCKYSYISLDQYSLRQNTAVDHKFNNMWKCQINGITFVKKKTAVKIGL